MRSILEGAGARRVDSADGPGTISYDIALEPAPSPTTIVEMLRGAAQTMAVSLRRR
jgi:hypothetical protein